MPRPPRADEGGAIYHALNRGNARQEIFRKPEDYEAMERVLAEGLEKHPVNLYAYQWMPNHWHLVLSPREDGAMSRLMYWMTMTHTQRYHARYHTTGNGHLYQGRYKSFPIQNDHHFYTVCRYVERHALAAGLVDRAENWAWGSLWNWMRGGSPIKLAAWPGGRLPKWCVRVNTPLEAQELRAVRTSIARSSPLGALLWMEETARRLKLESTLHARGRPRKFA